MVEAQTTRPPVGVRWLLVNNDLLPQAPGRTTDYMPRHSRFFIMYLISDGCSHYCEKARWALDRAGVLYRESKHVVLFHMFFTRGLGAGTSCPKFVMGRSPEQVVLQESPDILHFAEKNIRREENRLYPSDPEARKLVQSWEVKLDKRLGPHVRRWAYCYLLFDKCSYRMLTQGAPFLERVLAWFLMPFLRRIIYNALYCNKPAAKENSLKIIQEVFQEVDESLANGRPFICGSKFTAADLTFASLAGPMILPPGYGAWMTPLDEIPDGMRDAVVQLRKTTAGQVLTCFEVVRNRAKQSCDITRRREVLQGVQTVIARPISDPQGFIISS